MTPFGLEVEGLSKRYGTTVALDNVNLQIAPGRIVGLVGPNGAGKTTALRAILGLTEFDGELTVLGLDPRTHRTELMQQVCFIADVAVLPRWLRVAEAVDFVAGVHPRFSREKCEAFLARTKIKHTQRVRELSKGMIVQLHLALVMAIDAKLLVLDEPTLGLDVVAKRAFLESLMQSNVADDCTVIYCSHQMEEIERVADNLIILERGKLMHMSAPDDFCARVTHWVADIPFKGPDPKTVPGLLQLQRLDGLHHYLVLDQDEDFAEFLKRNGARNVQSMPVSLDRAVNSFLAKNDAAPTAAAAA